MKTIDTNALTTVTGGLSQTNQLLMSQVQSLSTSLTSAQNNQPNNNLALALVMGLALRNRD